MQYLADHKNIRKIFLCLDNDTAGNAACEKLAEKIPDDKMVMRLRPVKKDWNECLTAGIDRKDMAEEIPLKKKQVQEGNPIPVIKMSDVEEKVVQWLWYPFIPFGKVTLIQGNPGKGKTWLAMALCAYCTAGRELPNRTIQCLLPDRRGRSWRYDQAKTCKMWSRYDKSSFYQ